MSYRVVETTDRKNLGFTITSAKRGDVFSLPSGSDFRVEDLQVHGEELILSNPNYIIRAVKE